MCQIKDMAIQMPRLVRSFHLGELSARDVRVIADGLLAHCCGV
jgi:hypothetical protein